VSAQAAKRIAWANFALVVVLGIALMVFSVLTRSTPGGDGVAFDGVGLIPGLVTPTVGALIVTRQPRNPIGWIFCLAGLLLPLSGLSQAYASYTLVTSPGSLPGGDVAAWLSVWLFLPALVLLGPLFFMLFPDGRPLSPRWRPLVWVALFGLAAVLVGQWFHPGPLDTAPFEKVVNPFGISAAKEFLSYLTLLGFWAIVGAVLGAAASLVLRFRRSRGVTRLQLKWLAMSGVGFALAMVVSSVLFQLGYHEAGNVPVLLALVSVPIFAGFAMLRHRLYDVDVVINRTLVYALLTATLGGVYVGSVLLLQLVLNSVTSDSSLAVAVSTLAVAALFRPARTRIQGVVDRRFYRRKYDAARTLEQFSARLREQVDLDSLGGELRAVVAETMQPAHVSLWLRGGTSR
jgi:hypothetical protein